MNISRYYLNELPVGTCSLGVRFSCGNKTGAREQTFSEFYILNEQVRKERQYIPDYLLQIVWWLMHAHFFLYFYYMLDVLF